MDMEQESVYQTLTIGLAPEREGQPRMMTITGGDYETGHWYSPAAVREMLAAERERCAKIVDDMVRAVDGADALAAIRQA